MPGDGFIPEAPAWSLGQLTTSELARYRTALETALASAPKDSADYRVIQARLAGVADEQTERISRRMRAAYGDFYRRSAQS